MQRPINSSGKQSKPRFVSKLQKSLHELRQAVEIGCSVIRNQTMEWGLNQSSYESFLHHYFNGLDFLNLILVVYEMAFCSNASSLVDNPNSKLLSTFHMKLLSLLWYFIGWYVRRASDGLYLNQSFYINYTLQEHNLSHTWHVATPLSSMWDTTPAKLGEKPLGNDSHKRYLLIVGALSYLAICMRRDISYPISVLPRRLRALVERPLVLAKRVIRYNAGRDYRSIQFP